MELSSELLNVLMICVGGAATWLFTSYIKTREQKHRFAAQDGEQNHTHKIESSRINLEIIGKSVEMNRAIVDEYKKLFDEQKVINTNLQISITELEGRLDEIVKNHSQEMDEKNVNHAKEMKTLRDSYQAKFKAQSKELENLRKTVQVLRGELEALKKKYET